MIGIHRNPWFLWMTSLGNINSLINCKCGSKVWIHYHSEIQHSLFTTFCSQPICESLSHFEPSSSVIFATNTMDAIIADATDPSTTLYVVTEFLGYAGGVVLAVALVPQILHTCRTKSTADISFGWQCIYILGLLMNYVYFVFIGATAAWVTLTFEVGFAFTLFFMKVKLDGWTWSYGAKPSTMDSARKSEAMDPTELTTSDCTIVFAVEQQDQLHEKPVQEMFEESWSDLEFIGFKEDSVRVTKHIADGDALGADAFRGFHVMIDAVFDVTLPLSFGDTMMEEMIALAAKHGGEHVVHRKVECFDGSLSPPGFLACALIDESRMTAHCYSDQGRLAFDVFTCGSAPDNVRKVARDMLAFLKSSLGPNARFKTQYLSRFPKIRSGREREDAPPLEGSNSASLDNVSMSSFDKSVSAATDDSGSVISA